MKRHVLVPVVVIVAVALGACGGNDDDGDERREGTTKGARLAPTLEASKDAKGTVTYCMGKDSTGAQPHAVRDFNERYAAQGLKARIVDFPLGADSAHEQFVQRQRAKSPECDVFYADIIWTAEFAEQRWLLDMTRYLERRRDEFIPAALAPMRYDGKYWGVPFASGAGLLYYRVDRVPRPPATWQAVYDEARRNGGIVYQGAAYEGLTVDFLELAFAAGGRVLSDDGTTAQLDSAENLRALKLMVDGIESGAAHKAVVTYKEEEARRAFENGKPAFMRNWGYAYALGQKAPKVKGRFRVAPLPAFEGGDRAGVLGGNSPVISAYSRNPEGALLLIDFVTSPRIAERNMARYALPSTLTATYDAPAVRKAVPFAAELREAIRQAKPRPVSPVYPLITQAISENVNAALSGSVSPEAALKKGQQQIERALRVF